MFKGLTLSIFIVILLMVVIPVLAVSVTEFGKSKCHMTPTIPCWTWIQE